MTTAAEPTPLPYSHGLCAASYVEPAADGGDPAPDAKLLWRTITVVDLATDEVVDKILLPGSFADAYFAARIAEVKEKYGDKTFVYDMGRVPFEKCHCCEGPMARVLSIDDIELLERALMAKSPKAMLARKAAQESRRASSPDPIGGHLDHNNMKDGPGGLLDKRLREGAGHRPASPLLFSGGKRRFRKGSFS